jgi:hypothetical protein
LPREGDNPHRIKKTNVVGAEIKEVVGATRGRSGFSFAKCHDDNVMDKIREIYPIIMVKMMSLRAS